MEKTSKKLGTKHCPRCNKVIMRTSEFEGNGALEQKCPHCQVPYTVTLKTITVVQITLTALLLISLLISGLFLYKLNITTLIITNQTESP